MPLKPVFDSLRRAPWPTALVSLALLVALAATLAHWTWRFAAPVPPAPAPERRGDVGFGSAVETLRAAQLFGATPTALAAVERPTTLNLKLHGVFSATGERPAVAILTVDGQPQAIVRGRDIQPGVVLDAVAPDHVILMHRGVPERLDLEEVGRPLGLAGGATPVTRTDIDRALANPQGLGVKVRPGDGPQPGLVLAEVAAGGTAARLGLQSGDVLRMVNGNPVGDVQELARVLSGAEGGGHVTVVGERQGQPLNLTFRLQQER